jgi:RNA polymerase sigma-70 factor (ECF subfamily)
MSLSAREALEATYRNQAPRVLATLIRLLGGFDAAEEALQDAFVAATEQWPSQGVPANPYAWLVSTGRFKTIDRWRRQAKLSGLLSEGARLTETASESSLPETIEDDQLRLIFTCCHPALSPDARIALTLREVAGLTTEAIARAYLVPTPTIAQRIVRAKAKIRDEAIPYEVPSPDERPARLESVLQVLYLIFNEGYASSQAPAANHTGLCQTALRLGRLLSEGLKDTEAQSLLALMLLHEARHGSRVDAAGELVLLEAQDRSCWDQGAISEAQGLLTGVLAARRVGPFFLQAAIAAVHAGAPSFSETDWEQIITLYDMLMLLSPSPVVALNRAAAVAMREGPQAGLEAIEALLKQGELDTYPLAHAARADLQRRLGQAEGARSSYLRALELTSQPAEQLFLKSRLAQIPQPD